MSLGDEKYLALTTFKRDGTAGHHCSLGGADRRQQDRVLDVVRVGKGQAARATSKVTIQPCDARSSEARHITGRRDSGTGDRARTRRYLLQDQGEIRRDVHITKFLAKVGGFVKRKKFPYGDRGVLITPS